MFLKTGGARAPQAPMDGTPMPVGDVLLQRSQSHEARLEQLMQICELKANSYFSRASARILMTMKNLNQSDLILPAKMSVRLQLMPVYCT